MKIATKYHGTQSIEKNEIIHFKNGLPGFSDEKKFVLLPVEQDSPFFILQSTETAELGFVVAVPFDFQTDYDITLPQDLLTQLEITSQKDVLLLSILTVHDPFSESTMNLKAPVVINAAKQLAKQIVLNEETYSIRTPLFSEKTISRQGDF